MANPRQILPGSTYLLTRRSSERRYFLRPDGFVAQLFGYLLAVASARFDVDIYCVVVLGNHYRAVVFDKHAKLPRFLTWFHRLVAVVINAYRGRREAMWSSSKPSVVRLETPDDVLDKIIDVLGNAVAAGLVPHAADWPGFITLPELLLADPEGTRYARPNRYFSERGGVPRSARLRLSRPPGFEDLTDGEYVDLLRDRLAAYEQEQAEKLAAKGRSFAGPAAVLAVDWNDAPDTPEPRGVPAPHIAARDTTVRVAALMRLRAFRRDYRDAVDRWRRGERRVLFPAGTWWMRVRFGVSCHPPPEESPGAR